MVDYVIPLKLKVNTVKLLPYHGGKAEKMTDSSRDSVERNEERKNESFEEALHHRKARNRKNLMNCLVIVFS